MVNVTVKDEGENNVPLFQSPSAVPGGLPLVEVWVPPMLVQMTVSPNPMVSVAGAKEKLFIVTVKSVANVWEVAAATMPMAATKDNRFERFMGSAFD